MYVCMYVCVCVYIPGYMYASAGKEPKLPNNYIKHKASLPNSHCSSRCIPAYEPINCLIFCRSTGPHERRHARSATPQADELVIGGGLGGIAALHRLCKQGLAAKLQRRIGFNLADSTPSTVSAASTDSTMRDV